jgi:hypothetical protein
MLRVISYNRCCKDAGDAFMTVIRQTQLCCVTYNYCMQTHQCFTRPRYCSEREKNNRLYHQLFVTC